MGRRGRLPSQRQGLLASGCPWPGAPRMYEPCTPDALLEAVRGLRVAEPDLGFKPLLAKLRAQQPDLGAATKEARVALAALTAESEAREAAAAPPAADGVKWLRKGRLVDALCSTTAPAKHGEPAHFNAQNEPVNSHGKPYVKPPPPGQRGCNGGSRAAFKKREKEKEKRHQKSAALAAAPCEVREGSVGAEARARCDRLLEAQQEAEREAKQEAAEAARLAVMNIEAVVGDYSGNGSSTATLERAAALSQENEAAALFASLPEALFKALGPVTVSAPSMDMSIAEVHYTDGTPPDDGYTVSGRAQYTVKHNRYIVEHNQNAPYDTVSPLTPAPPPTAPPSEPEAKAAWPDVETIIFGDCDDCNGYGPNWFKGGLLKGFGCSFSLGIVLLVMHHKCKNEFMTPPRPAKVEVAIDNVVFDIVKQELPV